jgi:predicted transcriptional regulator of viral defense system
MADQEVWEALGRLAEEQAGYFTTAQAERVGVHRNTLRDQAREGGRAERAGRGLYRLRFYPRSPFEHIAAAWVQAGPDLATVSHESALELYGLADVAPADVHLTLPRAYRHRQAPTGVRLHWPRAPLSDDEIRRVGSVRATSPERTLLDVLESGTQPEQVELAIQQALERTLTTPHRLRVAADARSKTVGARLGRFLDAAR